MSSYFPHYEQSRNDDKLFKVRRRFGVEGYGVYFMLLEKALESKNYKLERDYDFFGFEFRVDSKVVKSIVEDFGLFEFDDDGKQFYSKRFLEHMNYKDDVSRKRSEAGRKGGEKKAENSDLEANAKQTDSKSIANAKQMPSIKTETKTKTETKNIKEKEKEKQEKEKATDKPSRGELFSWLDTLEISSELRLRVEAFIEMRKKIKKPLTLKALQLVMVRLSELSILEEDQIKILENSIVGGWQSVYPLKENSGQKSQGQKKDEELNDVLRRFVQKGE